MSPFRAPRFWRAMRGHNSQTRWLILLVILTLLVGGLAIGWPVVWPPSVVILPMVLAHQLLGPRSLPWFVIFALTVLFVAVVRMTQSLVIDLRISVTIAMVFAIGLVILLASFRRSDLGVAQTQGESMLVDLRDRILRQGVLPPVPAGWIAEWALRSADGTPFAGDFLVALRPGLGPKFEVCLVDVSGNGDAAGTRALMLSGAMGGLLGAVESSRFLPAANDFLLRQDWAEGFATAVHVVVDLETGDFEIRSAGHPPPVHGPVGGPVTDEGWQTIDGQGPALGIIDGVEYDPQRGRLEPGAVLILYTDGLVESRSRDLSVGIDELVRAASEITAPHVQGSAQRLIELVGSGRDDRGLFMIHRRPTS